MRLYIIEDNSSGTVTEIAAGSLLEACQQALDRLNVAVWTRDDYVTQNASETKTAYFNRFIVEMPLEAVNDCSHQGQCDEDVAHWAPKITIEATPDDIRAELDEYGAWSDEELADDEENKLRIVWIAAGSIQEEMQRAALWRQKADQLIASAKAKAEVQSECLFAKAAAQLTN